MSADLPVLQVSIPRCSTVPSAWPLPPPPPPWAWPQLRRDLAPVVTVSSRLALPPCAVGLVEGSEPWLFVGSGDAYVVGETVALQVSLNHDPTRAAGAGCDRTCASCQGPLQAGAEFVMDTASHTHHARCWHRAFGERDPSVLWTRTWHPLNPDVPAREQPSATVLGLGLDGSTAQALVAEFESRRLSVILALCSGVRDFHVPVSSGPTLAIHAHNAWGSRAASRLDGFRWASGGFVPDPRHGKSRRRLIVGAVCTARPWRLGAQPATAIEDPTDLITDSRGPVGLLVEEQFLPEVRALLACLQADCDHDAAVAYHELACAPDRPHEDGTPPPRVIQVTYSCPGAPNPMWLLAALRRRAAGPLLVRGNVLWWTPVSTQDCVLAPVARGAVALVVQHLQAVWGCLS